jgi:hypothetical protein
MPVSMLTADWDTVAGLASDPVANSPVSNKWPVLSGALATGSARMTHGRLTVRAVEQQGGSMKRIILAIALAAFAVQASAATCAAQSMEKKLAGAAEKSFMKKCEADAKATCEASAKEKKLAGAAQTSFVKKCLADAVGS